MNKQITIIETHRGKECELIHVVMKETPKWIWTQSSTSINSNLDFCYKFNKLTGNVTEATRPFACMLRLK